jgi:hypothetical protein
MTCNAMAKKREPAKLAAIFASMFQYWGQPSRWLVCACLCCAGHQYRLRSSVATLHILNDLSTTQSTWALSISVIFSSYGRHYRHGGLRPNAILQTRRNIVLLIQSSSIDPRPYMITANPNHPIRFHRNCGTASSSAPKSIPSPSLQAPFSHTMTPSRLASMLLASALRCFSHSPESAPTRLIVLKPAGRSRYRLSHCSTFSPQTHSPFLVPSSCSSRLPGAHLSGRDSAPTHRLCLARRCPCRPSAA